MRKLVALMALVLLAGCESAEEKKAREAAEAKRIMEWAAKRDAEQMDVLRKHHGVPADLAIRYTEARQEFCNNGRIIRLCVKVRVPYGLSREELELNVRHALIASKVEWSSAMAVSVLAYASSNLDSSYDAASGDFAPGGEWRRAGEDLPVSEWKMKIDLADGYFTHVEIDVGSRVQLVDKALKRSVGLYRTSSPNRGDSLGEVPHGTVAQVLDKANLGIIGMMYEVQTTGGRKRRGWVFGSSVQGVPATSAAK